MRIVTMFAVMSLAACATDVAQQDLEEDLTVSDDDQVVPDDLTPDTATPGDQSDPSLICLPDAIHGRVTRLSVDADGRMRARGTVFSDVAPCPTAINIRLTRDGRLLDSQTKQCSDESCTSRLLIGANPPGMQRFCATVRQTATGTVLDRNCITR